jgi:RNA polymerase sigma-70 factor, ECF subfamily
MFDDVKSDNSSIDPRQHRFESEAIPHLDALYSSALHLTRNRDDASDLVQETLLRAYRFFDRFAPGTNCKAWLFTILLNNFRNGCRRGGREFLTSSVESERELDAHSFREGYRDNGPEQALAARALGGAIDHALDSLPADFREVLTLVDVNEMGYGEAASVLGVPVGTVKSRVSRGRAMMRHALGRMARVEGLAASRPSLRFANRGAVQLMRPA